MLRATFSGFSVARSAMSASQKALDVTGQNISNVYTEGYTRQRLDQASFASGYGNFASTNYVAQIGNGVLVTGVSQVRDPYLDIQYRNQMANVGAIDAKASVLEQIESVFDETMKSAVKDAFSDLESKLLDLANSTGAELDDSIVRSSMQSLISLFHFNASSLEEKRGQVTDDFNKNSVPDVNELLKDIAELNKTIKSSQVLGYPALELQDERNSLIDELSSYVPIQVTYEDDWLSLTEKVDSLIISLLMEDGGKRSLIDHDKAGEFSSVTSEDGKFTSLGLRDAEGISSAVVYLSPDTKKINGLLNDIATLNKQIQDTSDNDTKQKLIDERTKKLNSLKTEVPGIQTTDGGQNITVNASDGTSVSLVDNDMVKSIVSFNPDTNTTALAPNIPEINELLKRVADLNGQLQGNPDNPALSDQRMALLDELKTYLPDATVDTNTGTVSITAKDGQSIIPLVDGNSVKGTLDPDNSDTISVKPDTAVINNRLQQIANLNSQIQETEPPDADLTAQRTALLDELKTYLPGIEGDGETLTLPTENGESLTLVNGDKVANTLPRDFTISTDRKNPTLASTAIQSDSYKPHNSIRQDGGGGTFTGTLNMLNSAGVFGGNATAEKGFEYYEQSFDLLISEFATVLNKLNEPNGPLFTTSDNSGAFTAKNITVNYAWIRGDVTLKTKLDPNSGTTQNDNINKMIAALNDKRDFKNNNDTLFNGNFYNYYVDIETTLGIDQKSTDNLLQNHITVINTIVQSRDQISGVSLDEEGVNLMQYQQSYTAAARLMTTLDDTLQTLLNVAGR